MVVRNKVHRFLFIVNKTEKGECKTLYSIIAHSGKEIINSCFLEGLVIFFRLKANVLIDLVCT